MTACTAPEEPLRVGVLAWPPYDLAYLALEEDLLDPEQFNLVSFQTPSELVRSFRYGLIDVMFTTSHFAVSMLHEVGDTRVIYLIDTSLGGDALLARPGVDADDLKGARIGVEVAPLGMYTLMRALDVLGLDRDEVEIVNIDTADQFDAWSDREIDALVTYEPTRSRLLDQGAVEVFSSKSIPNEILDVIVVKERTINAYRGALVALVGGLDRATSAYRRDPEATTQIMARRQAMSVERFSRAMAGVELFDLSANLDMMTGENRQLLDALEKQCRAMTKAGMLVGTPDLKRLIDSSIVEEAARR
ncbi:ABC transporter substrate-binding protein [Wenzhouxiangella sp. EGI_FJ10305]|uniref:ABC transporter substrate-binding protein n=1 Tax=Wenzhouxiangella sp. EGI_FJ10305 TaxID=3243768 RepID=UPI0035D6CC95